MRRRTPLTFILLALITVMWLYEWMTGAPDNEDALRQLGAIYPHMLENGDWWHLVGAMFLHGSWLHWAANAWALYQLGTLYELMFGTGRFALVYFVSGICASAASSLLSNNVAVGASGAIFGVLGAFIFSIRRSPRYRHQPWARNLIWQLLFWIVVNIGIGMRIKVIDNNAHVGGLITGLILGLLPQHVPPPPPSSSVIDVYGSE